MKTFILDTNVLLDDPSALFAFKENDIILPYKVIEELENHKTSHGEIGMNARDCARKISELFVKDTNLKNGVDLPGKLGKLKVYNTSDVKQEHIDFQLKRADDHILAVAVGLSKEMSNEVVLITNDVLLKIRASACGVSVEGYSGTVEISSIEELYTGYNKVKVSNSTMSKFWEAHGKEQDYLNLPVSKLTKETPLPNDFFMLNEMDKAIVRYTADGDLKIVDEQYANSIKPKNAEQRMAMDLLLDKSVDMVSLTGISGCGKTLISLAAGLEQVMNRKTYRNVVVIRPVHAVGKEIGFLPGILEEKLEPWIAPIKDNLRFILSNDGGRKSKTNQNALQYIFDKGYIEIEALTFIRGRSINNAFIIIDEAQNISVHEMKAILTRVGQGTKIVLTGDIEQTDRTDMDSVSNGLAVAIEKFKGTTLAGHVSLKEGVRSPLSELAAKIL